MKKLNISPWVMLVLGVVAVWLLLKIVGIAFQLLAFVAPVLLIAAIVIKRQVVIDYVKWLFNSVKKNAIMGIVFIVLSVLAFPFVSAYLLLKAINYDRFESFKNQGSEFLGGMKTSTSEEYTDFEVLDEKPLELPVKEKVQEKIKEDRSYDDLF